jgi:transcriptional regulator with XRE-family HTH domain
VRTTREDLQAAVEARGWSVRELLERSKLNLSRAALDRQLRGDTPMTLDVAERLARTIGGTITYSKRRAA